MNTKLGGRTSVRVGPWWSDGIQSWFYKQMSRTDIQISRRQRLERLANNENIKAVANRLKKAGKGSSSDDQTAVFLLRAIQAPDIWQSRKNKPNSFRDDDLRLLKRTCDEFLRVLEKERALAMYWFATIDEDRSQGSLHAWEDYNDLNPYLMARAAKRFEDLQLTIRGIAGAAHNNFQAYPPAEYVEMSRKRQYAKAETVFCIQYLLRTNRAQFGRPLADVVATTVTVLLDLNESVTVEGVKSIWKNIKGGNYDEIF